MKLLLVSPLPPPVGGIASWTRNLLEYYSIKIPSQWEIFHQNTAIKHRKITDLKFWSRIISGYRDSIRIISEFKINLATINPDIIHLTSSASFALIKDLLLINIANRRHIPVILHFRFGRIPELALKKNLEWFMMSLLVRKCKRVVVIDYKSYDTMIKCGFQNIVNLPNPISIETEKKARVQLISNPHRRKGKIVFVGHVIEKKGVFELVSSCVFNNKITELTLIGPYNEATRNKLELIASERDEGIWLNFTGSLENTEIQMHLDTASIFVFPSYSEGFPNVVIEAMSMGCPVIATNVGAIPEILNINSCNPCGICVNPKNHFELADAITNLIDHPAIAKELGFNGINRVLNSYSMSHVTDSYELLWQNALLAN